jgi:hypothetical protein
MGMLSDVYSKEFPETQENEINLKNEPIREEPSVN